ncbi:prophage LambdaBa04, site-specific recombinase, phage integrase family [Niallia circulans]|uniref:site-specific integrase n=1 Tax=Niallia circulans TaxID=1397 RepID=UPI00077C4AD3|nr:site-specific integrase [Niallia circulans]MDR4315045.1 site-specific integrase [Niallia circulans]MED3839776.1 site-specific integrase [Niallia circulans]MED4241262.1 site-specific integrase [Niallia circulans]MED4247923.1 site-specific integrase [Niallia circulans]QKH61598.1 site-specific integrase [Niallia circulans]
MKGYVRKRGKTWSYTVDVGRDPITNKRKQKTKSGFKTKKEAEKALNELNYELNNGLWIEPSKITFAEFANEFLDSYKPNIRQATYERYVSTINRQLIPFFGNIRLQDLKPIHGQRFKDEAIKKYKVSTIRKAVTFLKQILNHAVELEILNKNPFEKLRISSKRKNNLHVWTAEQLNKFLMTAKEYDTFYYNLFSFAAYTGMRKGEVLGLARINVDFANKVVTLKQSVTETQEGIELSLLKNESSYRQIAINDVCVEVLKSQIERNQYYKKIFKNEYQDNGLIFCRENGSIFRPTNLNRPFRRICKLAGVPEIRIHDLRHTHATILLELKVNPKLVADRLGHSSIKMTLDTYSHSSISMQSNVAELFEKRVKEL